MEVSGGLDGVDGHAVDVFGFPLSNEETGPVVVTLARVPDVRLVVGEKTKRHFLVNSFVLGQLSPVFHAMFHGNFLEARKLREQSTTLPEIPLPDDDPECMGLMLSYLHHRDMELDWKRLGFKPIVGLSVCCDKYDCLEVFREWQELYLDPRRYVLSVEPPERWAHFVLAAWNFQSAHFPRALAVFANCISISPWDGSLSFICDLDHHTSPCTIHRYSNNVLIDSIWPTGLKGWVRDAIEVSFREVGKSVDRIRSALLYEKTFAMQDEDDEVFCDPCLTDRSRGLVTTCVHQADGYSIECSQQYRVSHFEREMNVHGLVSKQHWNWKRCKYKSLSDMADRFRKMGDCRFSGVLTCEGGERCPLHSSGGMYALSKQVEVTFLMLCERKYALPGLWSSTED